MDVNQVSDIVELFLLQDYNDGIESDPELFQLLLESLSEKMQYDNTANPRNIPAGSSASQTEIFNAINEASAKYGIDSDLIKSVIRQESNYNPDAVSKSGAEGLMQLMPATAKSLGVNNPLDVLENVDAGTRYLKNLLNSFNGDIKLALAAYNGGIGRMGKLGVNSDDKITKMPEKTQNYVKKVTEYYNKYKEEANY